MTRSTKLPVDAQVTDTRFRDWIKEKIEPRVRASQIVSVTFPATANEELRVRHSLGAVPTGWTIIWRDAAGMVYADSSSPAATKDFIWLKANTASLSVKLEVF